jgi:hypothetical protein
MRVFSKNKDGARYEVSNLSFMRTKQAISVMDAIGRLIPQEGVDYGVEITFDDTNPSAVSLGIKAYTDKGELWKDYVEKMIGKYPPTITPPGEALPDDQPKEDVDEENLS